MNNEHSISLNTETQMSSKTDTCRYVWPSFWSHLSMTHFHDAYIIILDAYKCWLP